MILQAGWEDKVDFGLELFRDFPVEQEPLQPIGPPEEATSEELGIREIRPRLTTDICQRCHIRHERPVLFHELVSSGSSASSSTASPYRVQALPLEEGDSDLDSMPELEDESLPTMMEIPLWLIPNGVMLTFRRGRLIFEREQGPPWQEVLAQKLEEQELTKENN